MIGKSSISTDVESNQILNISTSMNY